MAEFVRRFHLRISGGVLERVNFLVAECHKIQSSIYFRESRFDENENFMSFIQNSVILQYSPWLY